MFIQKHKSTFLIVTVVLFLSLFVGYLSPTQIMELKIRNLMYELRGSRDLSHSDIIIVEMGQSADDEIPSKYPWPTQLYGKLIENLNRAGARFIGIDVIFDQPDPYDPVNDSLFASALGRYENVILAGRTSQERQITSDGTVQELSTIVYPNRVLRSEVPGRVGMVDLVRDQDDFIREYLLYQNLLGETHYSFGLEIIRNLYGLDHSDIELGSHGLEIGPLTIPLFRRNTTLINYYGGNHSFDYIGFEEVIDDSEFETVTEQEAFEMNLFDDPEYGLLGRGVLRDKIVLVGATMPELQDFYPVPIRSGQGSVLMAGVEIHAHAVQSILDQEFLYTVSTPVQVLLVILFSFLVVFSARFFSVRGGLLIATAMLALWMLLSVTLFIGYNVILFYLSPLFAILFGYGGVTVVQYATEEREKRRLREMFSSYVSPKLVDRLLETDDQWKLGGREMRLSALFTDIVDFTAISERMTPGRLMELMNEYLEIMADIVMSHEGTLDKFIGDAIMAFYGAPVDVDNHGEKACLSALNMQRALGELREKWQGRHSGYPVEAVNMRMRIGINTGQMTVGNMGSSRRFNYTVIGDQVNIAARCESICKEYGVGIIATGQTRLAVEEAGDECLFRFLDLIRVKGRSEPVAIYQLVGRKAELPAGLLSLAGQFEHAVQLYQDREWERALPLFSEIEKREDEFLSATEVHLSVDRPDISPGRIYLRRCEKLVARPPQGDWEYVVDQRSGTGIYI